MAALPEVCPPPDVREEAGSTAPEPAAAEPSVAEAPASVEPATAVEATSTDATMVTEAAESAEPAPSVETKRADATMETEASSAEPDAPRTESPTAIRPVVPLFQFIKEHRTRICEEFGLRMAGEVSRKCLELYTVLPEDERKVYTDRYAAQREAWAAYKASPGFMPPPTRREKAGKPAKKVKQAKGKQPERVERVERRKVRAEPEPPVPVLPHLAYVDQNQSTLMVQHGIWSLPELLEKAEEVFRELPEAKRQAYEDKYAEQTRVYEEFVAKGKARAETESAVEVKASTETESAVEVKEVKRGRKPGRKPKAFMQTALAKKGLRRGPKKGFVSLKKSVPPMPSSVLKMFEEDRREQIMAEFGLKAAGDVAKKAKELFEALNDHRRKALDDTFAKRKVAYDAYLACGKKALEDYKASLRAAEKVAKPVKEKTTPVKKRKSESVSSPGKAGRPKKAHTVKEEAEILRSVDAIKKAEEAGIGESGVSFVSLLRKLAATPDLAGLDEMAALALLQENDGNVNLTRNQLRERAQ